MNTPPADSAQRKGIFELASLDTRFTAHAAYFAVSFLILFSRRPDAILNPQFYAEDGTYWYADAYHFGLRCLLMPEAGYLHTLPRLVALFTLLFPFAIAPLIMNLSAIAVQILPVNLFLSSRFSTIPLHTRLLGSFLYLVLPNSAEIHGNTTNIQWHLALLALLMLLARCESSRLWQFANYLTLFLVSLDGPMGIFLLPVSVVLLAKRKDLRSGLSSAILLPGVIVQTCTVFFSQTRHLGSNGASVSRLVSILGRQIFLGPLLGTRSLIAFIRHGGPPFVLEAIATAIGVAVLLYALRYGPLELKLFISFAAILFAACLARPLAADPGEQWELMMGAGHFTRYYFFPMLAFLAALIWLVRPQQGRGVRYAALAILLLLPVGIFRDWYYPPFADLDFPAFAEAFKQSTPGTKCTILLNPPGWEMQLTKH